MYIDEKSNAMELVDVWKQKIDEAMAIFKDMSQLAKLEAVSYWKDAGSYLLNCDDNSGITADQQQRTRSIGDQDQPQETLCQHQPEMTINIDSTHLLPTLTSGLGDIFEDSVSVLTTQNTMTIINDGIRNFPMANYHETTSIPNGPTLSLSLIPHGESRQDQQLETNFQDSLTSCPSLYNQLDDLHEQDFMDALSNFSVISSPISHTSLDTEKVSLDEPSYCLAFGDNTIILDESNSKKNSESDETFTDYPASSDCDINTISKTIQFCSDNLSSSNLEMTVMDDVRVNVLTTPIGGLPMTTNIFDSVKDESDQLQQVCDPSYMSPLESGNCNSANRGRVEQHYEQSGHLNQTMINCVIPRSLFGSQTIRSDGLHITDDLTLTDVPQNHPHTCDICGKTGFASKGNLKRHRDSHSGKKPYKCDICSSSFTEKKNLTIHMRRHSGERPHKCEICDRAFAQAIVLKNHVMTHQNDRGFSCTICDKTFKLKSALRRHNMRHEGVKRFHCPDCEAQFFFKTDMERHMRKHTGERPFACDLCDKRFQRRQVLDEHRNRHFGRAPYTCEYCRKSFPELSAFRKHVKQHTGDGTSSPESKISQLEALGF